MLTETKAEAVPFVLFSSIKLSYCRILLQVRDDYNYSSSAAEKLLVVVFHFVKTLSLIAVNIKP